MATDTPKKKSSDIYLTSCRCCNDDVGNYQTYLFGKKAAKEVEKIVAAIIALTEIDVSEEDELPKYICCYCAGKISNLKNKVDEFKKVCQESVTKQREELEFGNVKRGRNDETADKSPCSKKDQNIGQSCVTFFGREFAKHRPQTMDI